MKKLILFSLVIISSICSKAQDSKGPSATVTIRKNTVEKTNLQKQIEEVCEYDYFKIEKVYLKMKDYKYSNKINVVADVDYHLLDERKKSRSIPFSKFYSVYNK